MTDVLSLFQLSNPCICYLKKITQLISENNAKELKETLFLNKEYLEEYTARKKTTFLEID